MKRILVPTDFSDCSYYAAEVAAQIAKKTGARVFLLHALEVPQYSSNEPYPTLSNTAEGIFMMKLVKQEYEKLISQPFFNGVNVAEVVQWENVYDTITKQSKEHDIDLIVMGSHGAKGAKEFFVGSNAEKIVRTASCPVITVKSRLENFVPKELVYASSFYGETLEAFSQMKTLIDLFKPRIHLLKVITPANFESTDHSEKLMKTFIDHHNLENYTMNVYNEVSVERGIHEFANSRNADLLAMETHGRRGLAHFFRQSLAEDVANHTELPLITMKIPEEEQSRGAIFPD